MLTGRNKSNLSRTLKTMSRYGLVELEKGRRGKLIAHVPYEEVRLDVSLLYGLSAFQDHRKTTRYSEEP